jgi:hypothetical protein
MHDFRDKRRRQIILFLIAMMVVAYVGSYVVLSRRGFAEADEAGLLGFYFVPYEDTETWWPRNYTLVCIYYPLIFIDYQIGTGRLPGCEPLRSLSVTRTP